MSAFGTSLTETFLFSADKKLGVTALPYFSVMEFGGGPPEQYAMTCLPEPNEGETSRDHRALAEHRPSLDQSHMGPVAIQKCTSPEPGAALLWTKLLGTCGCLLLCVYTCQRLIDLSVWFVYTCRRLIDLSLIAGVSTEIYRLQLHVPGPGSAKPPLCLTAVATTSWCGDRDVLYRLSALYIHAGD